MSNKSIVDKLLVAMEMVAEHEQKKSGADTTLSGTVVSQDGTDRTKYIVRIDGADRQVSSTYAEYKLNDEVYVTLPGGTISGSEGVIIGLKYRENGGALSQLVIDNYDRLTGNAVVNVGDTYSIDNESLRAAMVPQLAVDGKPEVLGSDTLLAIFNLTTNASSANGYSVNFKVRYKFAITEGPVTANFAFTIDDVHGNPYSLNNQQQFFIIKLPEGAIFHDVEQITTTNVVITDLELYGARNAYEAKITRARLYTPTGSQFGGEFGNTGSLQLVAQMRHEGLICALPETSCYWFKEDPLVTSSNAPGYSLLGGIGWRLLNASNVDGDAIPEYHIKNISQSDIVRKSIKYKCVVDYNGRRYETAPVEILNNTNTVPHLTFKAVEYGDTTDIKSDVTLNAAVETDGGAAISGLYTYTLEGKDAYGQAIAPDKLPTALSANQWGPIDLMKVNLFDTYTCTLFLNNEFVDRKEVKLETQGAFGNVPLTLSLDNDSDVIVKTNEGTVIGINKDNPLVVNVHAYAGSEEVTFHEDTFIIIKDYQEESNGMVKFEWVYDKVQEIAQLRIYDLATSTIKSGDITIVWQKDAEGSFEYASKKFTFNVITSNVDYDLVVSQTVVNTSGTVAISALKKTSDGTTLITNINKANEKIALYLDGVEYTGNWDSVAIDGKSRAIELKSTATDLNNLIWDKETIEVVKDGEQGPAGPSGSAPYTMSLDNDSDVVVRTDAGTWLDKSDITVQARCYYGSASFSTPQITIAGPTGTWWSDNTKGQLTIKVGSIPTTVTSAVFTFSWTIGSSTITKQFSLKVLVSNIDYDLILDKTVVNVSNGEQTVTAKVLKKDASGSSIITAPGTKGPYIYEGDNLFTSWKFTFDNDSSNKTLVLKAKVQAGTEDKEIEFDSETIEVVKDGTSGNGVKETAEYYYATTTPTFDSTNNITLDETGEVIIPDGWKTTVNATGYGSATPYLWNTEVVKYTQAATKIIGPNLIGSSGKGIKSITEYYQLGDDATSYPSPPTYNGNGTVTLDDWSTEPSATTSQNKYLYNYELIVYTDDTYETNNKVAIIGAHGDKGTDGNDGISFSGVVEYYKASDSSTKVPDDPGNETTPPTGWSTTIADAGHSETNKYLWNIEGVKSKDASDKETITYTKPDMIQVWNGRTIESIISYYATNKDATSAPAGAPTLKNNGNTLIESPDSLWSTNNAITAADEAVYLWEVTVTKYKSADANGENTYELSSAHVIGYNGANGTSPYVIELSNDNVTITTDVDGKVSDALVQQGTETTVSVYYGGTNITDKCSFNWSVDNPEKLGVTHNTGVSTALSKFPSGIDIAKVTVTVTQGTGENQKTIGTKTMTVSKSKTGAKGSAAVIYQLKATPASINMSNWTSASEITFEVTKITGDAAPEPLLTGYTIKLNGEDINNSYEVPNTFTGATFELYIGDNKVDSETVSVVKNGDKGDSPYTLSLSNDNEVIAHTPAGGYLGESTGVLASTIVNRRYGKDLSTEGGILVTKSSDLTVDQDWITVNNTTVNITGIKPGTTSGTVTFSWQDKRDNPTKIYDTATLSIAIVESLEDYSLVCSKSVVNLDSTDKTVALQVKKKTVDNTDGVLINEPAGQIKIYQGTREVTPWSEVSISNTTTFTLKVNGIVWDTETVEVVHDGANAYSIALDNDSDIIAVSGDTGNYIGNLPTITAQTYLGKVAEPGGVIKVTSSNCTIDKDDSRTVKIQTIDEDAKSGTVTFTWSPNGTGKTPVLSKTFTFNVITSPVDYDLVIPQTVFNSTTSGGTITVGILAKKEGSKATSVTPSSISDVTVWHNKGGSFVELEENALGFSAKQTNPITFELRQGTTYGGFLWDSEVVEFVQDGSKGDTGDAAYAFTTYRLDDNRLPRNTWNLLGEIGETNNWNTDTDTYGTKWRKLTIAVGDLYQVIGVDEYGASHEVVCEVSRQATSSATSVQGKCISHVTSGEAITTQTAYYRSNSPTPPSSEPTTGQNETLNTGWAFVPWGVTDKSQYEYINTRTKKTTNGIASYGSWGAQAVLWAKYGAPGSDAEVTTLNTFNALTGGGQNKGLYYAQNGAAVDPPSGSKLPEDYELYINADMIKSGKLTVGDNNGTVFDASINSNNITLGHFNVTANGKVKDADRSGAIYSGKTSLTDSTEGVYLGTDGIAISGSNGGFKVDTNGNATFTGEITATKLTIVETADVSGVATPADVNNAKNDAITEIEGKGYQTANEVTQITKDTVTTTYIQGLSLKVGNEIQMGENATISWANVDNKPDIPSDDHITTIIGQTSIRTDQIEVTDLNAFGATIGGFTIDSTSIRKTKESYVDNKNGIYIGTEGISIGAKAESGGDYYGIRLNAADGSANIGSLWCNSQGYMRNKHQKDGRFVFEIDPNGNLNLTGTVYATAGEFTGDIKAGSSISIKENVYIKADGSAQLGGFTLTQDGAASFTGGVTANEFKIAQDVAESANLITSKTQSYTQLQNNASTALADASAANTVIDSWTTTAPGIMTGGASSESDKLIDCAKIAVNYIKGKECTSVNATGYTTSGMFINLTGEGSIHAQNFYLGSDGSARFRGDIEGATINNGNGTFSVTKEGVITAKSGTIGACTIGTSSLSIGAKTSYADGNKGVYIDSTGIALGPKSSLPSDLTGCRFNQDGAAKIGGLFLSGDGLVRSMLTDKTGKYVFQITPTGDLSVVGNITATSGNFSNCTIDGTCTIEGELDGARGTFSGTLTSSTIIGGEIRGSHLTLGNNFSATSDGSINARAGTIGNLNLDVTGISSTYAKMYSAASNTTVSSPVSGTSALTFSSGQSLANTSGSQTLTITIPESAIVTSTRIAADGNTYTVYSIPYGTTFQAPNVFTGSAVLEEITEPTVLLRNSEGGLVYNRGGFDEGSTALAVSASVKLIGMPTINGVQVTVEGTTVYTSSEITDNVTVLENNKPAKFNITVDTIEVANSFKVCADGFVEASYLRAGTISSGTVTNTNSDIRLKNSITTLSNDYSILFDNLQPVTFKYNNGNHGRTHIGFIAQDIIAARELTNITSDEFAPLCLELFEDGEKYWTVRYGEFIALNTDQIQKAKIRIATLEAENILLKSRLEAIEASVQRLIEEG